MNRMQSTDDLFDGAFASDPRMDFASGAALLRGFALSGEAELITAHEAVVAQSPFRHMVTPGGQTMSVAMTNCGYAGWVSDRKGYRYDHLDPLTGEPWPQMPVPFLNLARQAAVEVGYNNFEPDACLINRYVPGARLTLHQDRNEQDFDARDRLGLARLAGKVSVRRPQAKRPTSAHHAPSRRRRCLGRTIAPRLSRRRHSQRRRAPDDWTVSH